jgi:hypothetical protein
VGRKHGTDRAAADGLAVNLAASELGKLSWRKRKAREDERNARLAALETENARLRALLAEQSDSAKNRETT